jgi:phosphoribosyl 1,2-cyclic phosphodiesterase
MHIRVLASSSAGNCTVFWNGGRALLVDIGLSQRYISRHLDESRLAFRTIGGVLITHTHGDHVHPETLKKILDLQIPVYCPSSIASTLQKNFAAARKAAHQGLLRVLDKGAGTVAGFDVEAFPVPHDAPGGCFGYAIHDSTLQGTTTAVISTDLGFAPDGLAGRFADADAIVLESNHDTAMLENSRRPDWLKRRIREIGHLSNDQSVALMSEILAASRREPKAVVLAHISRECNTIEQAHATMQQGLHAIGAMDMRVVDSFRNEPNEVVTLTAGG